MSDLGCRRACSLIRAILIAPQRGVRARAWAQLPPCRAACAHPGAYPACRSFDPLNLGTDPERLKW